MEDQLILVDMNDCEIGTIGKTEAHSEGRLHRAFSIFIFHENKMLLQKRNKNKYHSGGKWANACCSHMRVGEKTEETVHRRLAEELGIDCDLKEIGSFTYYSKYKENLSEYEYDHIFIGEYFGDVYPNPIEVEEVKWVDIHELEKNILCDPDSYATWFLIALSKVITYLQTRE